MSEKEIIRKVSKGRQNRVTIPKYWKSEYVVLKQIDLNKILGTRRKF